MATGDHGNARCAAPGGPTPPPPPGVTHLRTSPEKRLGESGREAGGRGPEVAGSGRGGSARAAVCVWRRSSGRPRVNPSARQSVLPPVSPSRVGGRSAQPLADCSCQAAPEPSSCPTSSQSSGFPEAPEDPAERGGQASACAEGRPGRAGPGLARWGDACLGGPAPAPRSKDQLDPRNSPSSDGDRASRNNVERGVAS